MAAVLKKQVVSSTTWYVYADEGLVGEYSASGYWLKSYGWYPNGSWGTDHLYMRDGSGLYWYHNDHLGTPQRMTSASDGVVAWSAGYTAFGQTIDPLSTIENNLRFPGSIMIRRVDCIIIFSELMTLNQVAILRLILLGLQGE